MDKSLDYARHERTTQRPFWPALVIAMSACPVTSVTTALLGAMLALRDSWLSPANFRESTVWGLSVGTLGGVLVSGFARAFRSQAVLVSVLGSLIVSVGIGVAWFLFASMAAD